MSKTGAIILLTATTELIVEMSSVELFGRKVLRFSIFSVPVPTSTFSYISNYFRSFYNTDRVIAS